jgi:hypothetical protein
MIRLPVRVISEGVSSLTLAMLKVKVLSKVFKPIHIPLVKTSLLPLPIPIVITIPLPILSYQ